MTCRDWFQLTLKEGLTVYRDAEFSADMNSRGLKRIESVASLRAAQFPEDAGTMAHPIRPESYIKMDNFYTMTVYEKGSEVVRLYRTLLGEEGFRCVPCALVMTHLSRHLAWDGPSQVASLCRDLALLASRSGLGVAA